MPGPYQWIIRSKTYQCKLVTDHSGQYYVIDFTRWGMQDACPKFQVYYKYEGAVRERGSHGTQRTDSLAKPIGGLAYQIGHDEYIDHPDTVALEKSWEDIDALLSEVDRLGRDINILIARAEATERDRDAVIEDINAMLRNEQKNVDMIVHEVDKCDSDNYEDTEWRGPREAMEGEAGTPL